MALTLDHVSSEPLLLHHFTQVGETLRKNKISLVALSGVGPTAAVANFASAKDLFEHAIKFEIPPKIEFSKFQTLDDFRSIKTAKTSESFRSAIVLPPCTGATFLSICLVAHSAI